MSTIAEIFKLAKDYVSKERLIPFSILFDDKARTSLQEEIDFELPSINELKDGISYLDRGIEHFFFLKGSLSPFCYYKGPVFVEIHSFEVSFLEQFQIKNRIEEGERFFQELIEKGHFERLFAMVDEKIAYNVYEELFSQIPDDQKYELFVDLYVSSDYGFGCWDQDFLRKIFSYRTKLDSEKKTKLEKIADSDGFVSIYRGMGRESTPIEKSFSWTTNFGTALFFAGRFSLEGQVWEAKVHMDDVIDYLDQRNEREVLVDPNVIKDAQPFRFISTKDTLELIEDSGHISEYHYWVGEIKRSFFHNPDGPHGVLHTKRVLLLNLILSFYLDLNSEDTDILARCAVYHDIGRTNDDEDEEHGKKSVKKVIELELFEDDGYEDDEIFKFIVENHCISDEEGISSLPNYEIYDTERAINLYKIFKDGDGLDRVRFNDLDIKYLRFLTSKELSLMAYHLKSNVR